MTGDIKWCQDFILTNDNVAKLHCCWKWSVKLKLVSLPRKKSNLQAWVKSYDVALNMGKIMCNKCSAAGDAMSWLTFFCYLLKASTWLLIRTTSSLSQISTGGDGRSDKKHAFSNFILRKSTLVIKRRLSWGSDMNPPLIVNYLISSPCIPVLWRNEVNAQGLLCWIP